MSQSDGNGKVMGFFVTIDEIESNLLRKEMVVDTARAGVYYKKEELLSTLQEHDFKEKQMHIVEIEVNQHCIANPNCKKFGIKKGNAIPIRRMQTYQEALTSMEKEKSLLATG